MIFQLEKEGEKYGAEAAEASAKYAHALDEVKVREMSIVQLQKRIADGDAKLKQQQALYEAVRSDRNLYSKNLIESQDEIAEMKRKFKIMNHQIEQLKEEIHAKDQALVKEHFDHMKVEKEKELLRARRAPQGGEQQKNARRTSMKFKRRWRRPQQHHQRGRQGAAAAEEGVRGRRQRARHPRHAAHPAQRRAGAAVREDQDPAVDAAQGRAAVLARVREIEARSSCASASMLRASSGGSSGSVTALETLRNEVYQLQRELLQERTKVRALSEELENPMNVHRWRKLEGSDPATYELVQKIHMLQKRLIEKTEEVVEKDLLIHHKEKLYVELKNILARQPGPEVAEQWRASSTCTRRRRREYKYEIEPPHRDAQDLKRALLRGWGGEQLERERGYEAPEVKLRRRTPTQARGSRGAGSVSRNADTRSAPTPCNRSSHPPPRQRPRAASRGSIIQHSYYSVLHAAKDTNVGQRRSSLTGPARSSWRPHTSMPFRAARGSSGNHGALAGAARARLRPRLLPPRRRGSKQYGLVDQILASKRPDKWMNANPLLPALRERERRRAAGRPPSPWIARSLLFQLRGVAGRKNVRFLRALPEPCDRRRASTPESFAQGLGHTFWTSLLL